MGFDPVTGLMYLTGSGTKVLYSLNTTTGALSFISTGTIGDQLAGLNGREGGPASAGFFCCMTSACLSMMR
jgi:hypothetical protein